MADAPTLEQLTRLFLDLWQDQVAALAADPKTAEHWHRMVELALGLPTAATAAAFGLAPGRDGGATPGPTAAAAAPGLGGNDPGRLAGRVAALERRLAAMGPDAVADGGGAGPRRAGRKPRAKPGGPRQPR